MGFNINTSSTSSGKLQTPQTLAEINVTPLVDVMLVLLIIFMISAPLMQQGTQVDLPKANTGSLSEAQEPIVLVVNHKQEIQMNGSKLQKGQLFKKLSAIAKAKPDVQVFIQADQKIEYGFIAQLIAEVKRSKINRVGLVTQPGETNSKF